MSVPAFAFAEKEIPQGILTAVQLHAILHYSEVWDLRETAMSFRFSSWTKVSLILLASHPFWTAFCDKKVPWGLGKSAKREGVLENLFLGSLFSRVLGDSIACNPYRLRYWNTTTLFLLINFFIWIACNPYRLRYWNSRCEKTMHFISNCMQSIPLAVLKLGIRQNHTFIFCIACNPYRLRYWNLGFKKVVLVKHNIACNPYRLRYWNQERVLQLFESPNCMQSIPLAVLKRFDLYY